MPYSSASNRNRGFSLVELMVALVAGMIVVGAVLAFALSTMRTNTQYVQSTQLTQQLRNAVDYASRELRRAGYDESAMDYYAQTATPPLVSPFSNLLIVSDTDGDGTSNDACVIYSYDRQPGTPGVINLSIGEVRGIRRAVRTVAGRQVGVIEVAESSSSTGQITCSGTGSAPDYSTYPATCSSKGWCAMTDPRILDVSSFIVDTSNSPPTVTPANGLPLTMRDLRVTLQGSLIQPQLGEQDSVIRGVRTEVRVRADCLRTQANCNVAPLGT